MPALPSRSGPGSSRGPIAGGELTVPAKRLADGISAEVPDWNREAKTLLRWSPGRSLLATIRSYQYHAARAGLLPAIWRRVAVARHIF